MKKKKRGLALHWDRLKRSLGRRYREWRLPAGYERLGTRYGGWWVDSKALSAKPLLIDCGLGEDISFPLAFLAKFPGQVLGVEPNPRSLAYCRPRLVSGMEIVEAAFWKVAGESITFHLPRSQDHLPKGADGVSGSLVGTHEYVEGGEEITVRTVSLPMLLEKAGREVCDVLKLDVEGAEYDILKNLLEVGHLRRVRQLLIEFHHAVTHHGIAETQATVALLQQDGFALMHVEGRNYIFLRRDNA